MGAGGVPLSGSAADAASTVAIRQTAGSTTWRLQATPSPTGAIDTRIEDVSCTTATSCTAVGIFFNSRARGPVVARWNGTSWAQQTPGASLGSGRSGDGLRAVSCSATSACMAVGDYTGVTPTASYGTSLPVAQKWNGTSWSTKAMPIPAGSSSVIMKSVACTSATACFAVGGYRNSGNQAVPLLVRWDGTEWSIVDIPDTSGSRDGLNAVACSASNACTAVGGTLVLRWNGTSWARENVPLPDGTQFADLTDVSCTAAAPRPCTAIGGYSTYSPHYATQSLIERWDGTGWSLQSSIYGVVTDVSCPALSSCTGVGGYAHAHGWDGGTEWTGKGYIPGYTAGVSCTAASACTSVGALDGQELVVRVIFAGLQYANRTITPAAARYSEAAQAGASARAATNRELTPAFPDGTDIRSPALVRSR